MPQAGKSGVGDPDATVEVDVCERGGSSDEASVGDVAVVDVQVSDGGRCVEEESESCVSVAGVRKSESPERSPRSAVQVLRVIPEQLPETGKQTRSPVWRSGACHANVNCASGQFGSPSSAREASDGQVFVEKRGDEFENFAGKARPISGVHYG